MSGFEISGINVPARQVSGDYFDYIKVDEERLGVCIADVSGKGVPASLIMAICRSVLRSQAIGNNSPADVLRKVNRQLYPDIKEDMFISMAYLVLDHARNGVALARAGHDAPLLYQRKSQTVAPLKAPGMVVGIDSGDVFDRLTTDVAMIAFYFTRMESLRPSTAKGTSLDWNARLRLSNPAQKMERKRWSHG